MTAPRISVLLPCYNHGAFLDEAVGSVLAQTVQDFEIIVVDDGSSEPATVEKLRTYSAPRTTVLHTANRGLPAARNHAAAHAAGEIFCALDADDRLAPTWFEKALAVLDARPEIAFVSHWLETFGDERWVWQPERCDLPSLLARNTVNGAALVRRSAFETVGGYDEAMRRGCEDWDLWLRLVERGFEGTIVPEVLFFYRRRSDSMSRVMVERDYREPLAALIARHGDAFRTHAVDVLADGAREFMRLSNEVLRLESDDLSSLGPALARADEDLRALALQRRRAERRLQTENEIAALRTRLGELECMLSAEREHAQKLGAALDTLGHERARLAAIAANAEGLERHINNLEEELVTSSAGSEALQAEILALRSSLSWKVTQPLRRVVDRVRGR